VRAAEFFQRCLDAGMPTDMAITAMRAFEAEVEIVIDMTLDKRRSSDRARQAKKREKDNVKSREVTLEPVTHVTTRDQRDGQDARAPVHTRGENNLSRLVDTSFADVVVAEAREAGSDWPAGKAAQHAKLLVEAVSSSRLDPSRMPDLVTTAGLLDAWKRCGASWEHDVLPVVTALTRKTGPPIRNWKYFDPAIAQSVADNRRALQIPAANGPRHERPDPPSPKFDRKQANLERSIRGAQSAARRGAF
jgi:hypothetical protein